MASYWAARVGVRVLLLEGTGDGGRKILMSGGGRCNILPSEPAPERFVTDSSPNTLRKILNSWPLREQRAFFEGELGLPLAVETETGKVFPAGNDARKVRDLLLDSVRELGADCRFGARAKRVSIEGGGWRVELEDGQILSASAVIIATGGCSYPATGSDGWGFGAAKNLGHTVNATYPALVPLAAEPPIHSHLAGISLDVSLEVRAGKRKVLARGGFLFTHSGYSGPAILDISHVAVRSAMDGGERARIFVGWTGLDAAGWESLLLKSQGTIESIVARRMPTRLAETLCGESGVDPGARASNFPREVRQRLVDNLTRYELPWSGHGGYPKAEVTGGGVDLKDIDPRTMESKIRKGLFFCGEVLDAFGPIGGHNFQWAWATGRAAGLGARGNFL